MCVGLGLRHLHLSCLDDVECSVCACQHKRPWFCTAILARPGAQAPARVCTKRTCAHEVHVYLLPRAPCSLLRPAARRAGPLI